MAIKNPPRVVNYINDARLRELQLLELDILKAIDRVCKANDIKYYLDSGTLLGAIRHKGFIPWDDDLDIIMFREDYDKFVKVAPDALDEGYELLHESVYPDYYLQYAKVVMLDKHDFHNQVYKFDDKYLGPYVDVFVYDPILSPEETDFKAEYAKIFDLRLSILLKAGHLKPDTPKKEKLAKKIRFKTMKSLKKEMDREMHKYHDTGYVASFASSDPIRQRMPVAAYAESVDVPFEDGMFPVPKDYDDILTRLFGDYMTPPPVAKRWMKHGFYDPVSIATMDITKPEEDRKMQEAIEREEKGL